MTTEKVVRIFAGAVVLISLALGTAASPVSHSALWLWVTLFVGRISSSRVSPASVGWS